MKQEGNQGIAGAATTWQQGRAILYTGLQDSTPALFWAYTTVLPHIALLLSSNFTQQHTISVYRNQLIVDGETINDDTQDRNVPTDDSLKLFKVLQLGSYVRIHSCKIYENNILVKDLIPVTRKSDGVKCFYDLLTSNYYVNIGTGDLISG